MSVFAANTQLKSNQNLWEFNNYVTNTNLHNDKNGQKDHCLSQITVLRAYSNNPLYPQGKPDGCVVGEKTFSTQLDMKDTTLSNGVNV